MTAVWNDPEKEAAHDPRGHDAGPITPTIEEQLCVRGLIAKAMTFALIRGDYTRVRDLDAYREEWSA